MLMELLVFYEQAYQFIKRNYEFGKQYMREWLGPAPQDYLLLDNDEILPAGSSIPLDLQSKAFRFSAIDSKIRPFVESESTKFLRFPWVTIVHSWKHIDSDLSDILSEIRYSSTIQTPPSLIQMIRLVAVVRNEYLSEHDASITVVTRMGETEKYKYSNSVQLEQVEQ